MLVFLGLDYCSEVPVRPYPVRCTSTPYAGQETEKCVIVEMGSYLVQEKTTYGRNIASKISASKILPVDNIARQKSVANKPS